jgi:DNA-binding MarR family transcriptional regulator
VRPVHDIRHDDALGALDQLFELTVLMTDAMEHDLRDRGLTRARATLVAYLRRGGPMTQRELAGALRVVPRYVTELVDALQEAGLVERNSHPQDRRAILVSLTEHGRAAAEALEHDRREFAAFLLARIPAAGVAEFSATLDQLLARLHDPQFAELRSAALDRWSSLPSTSPAEPDTPGA